MTTTIPKYSQKPICVVSGVGSGTGTGNACARLFGKRGYRVALIARYIESLQAAVTEINGYEGGEAAAFPITQYNKAEVSRVFKEIKAKWPGAEIRVAIYNTGHRVAKPFLELTQHDIGKCPAAAAATSLLSDLSCWANFLADRASEKSTDESVQTNILGGFAFSQEAILSFREYAINELGNRGVLIFTSATSAWRGNPTMAAFAAGKHGVRALSQSLNKEFGKQNIHVAHAIIDGPIITKITRKTFGTPEWDTNPDIVLNPADIATAYWYLAHQPRSAWTWEIDLRPAHETW
ncbi:NAD(P)-binding protein [Cantharellus anzutake]|uniref:NAD(P)-binding protein n=1 Tax=Cantharellus anzutake TaxID=1750568 RepID=UPI001903B7AD|nr:NAD(P)-binding protein [Cantharellus anzutake]KAF8339666.1 NAD(P)-binding protein [Cantharellus anzutake]